MRAFNLVLIAGLSLMVIEAHAKAPRARRSPASASAPSCNETPRGRTMQINQTTGYAPSLGGINGKCSGGASVNRGFPACTNTLHSFIEGRTPFFMAATQQKTGSAGMFGCWAVSKEVLSKRNISEGPNSCAVVAMVDHYARSEDIGRVGAGKKLITEAKIDVEVSRLDSNYKKLSRRTPASFTCVKRAFGVQNKDNRHKPFRVRRHKA